MREIKFRAWHKEEKLMCDVSIINILDGAFCIGVKRGDDSIISGTRTIVLAPSDGRFCNWDEIELMQYTGLKDKNGKEIYENDLVQSDKGILFKISWSEHRCQFCAKRKNPYKNASREHLYQSMIWVIENCKVVGNIYENQ